MEPLLLFNLCSLLSLLVSTLLWASCHLDPSYLTHLAVALTVNPILGKLLTGKWSLSRLVKVLVFILIDLLTSIPVFIGLIALSAIHIHTLEFKYVLLHALILTLLTIGPNSNHSFLRLFFVEPQVKSSRPIDTFMMLNIFAVLFASWGASFSSGLDDNLQVSHYPVASCVGALVGSALVNFATIAHYLFQRYNTLGVY